VPGTQFKSYADGLYVADAPTGPFRFAPSSPFSHKPTGFAAGAGHSSTYTQPGGGGHLWHVSTITISVRHMCSSRASPNPNPNPSPNPNLSPSPNQVRHMFERRLGIFPLTHDAASGTLVAD